MYRRNPETIPTALKPLFAVASKHRDPVKRFRLYALLAKHHRLGDDILETRDEDLRAVQKMVREVERDTKRAIRSVRFASHIVETVECMEAWCETKHLVLADVATFYARYLPNVRWTIRTPDGAASWDMKRLTLIEEPFKTDELKDLHIAVA